jgi:hypothetical protein
MFLNLLIYYTHGLGASSRLNVSVSICTCFSTTYRKLFFWFKEGFEVLIFQDFECIEMFHNRAMHSNLSHGGLSKKGIIFSFKMRAATKC